MKVFNRYNLPLPLTLLITLSAVGFLAVFAPLERTLGANIRLVYVHGAWVWTGMIAFGFSAAAGLAALLSRQDRWRAWSQALARTGLVFWWTYLPMSLLVMQLNWGGIYLDEPRWRIPFTFGIVGLLLQTGLSLIKLPALTSAANLFFGAVLLWNLGQVQNVLHPDSPILNSNSKPIQIFFSVLVLLALLVAGQVTLLWKRNGKIQEDH